MEIKEPEQSTNMLAQGTLLNDRYQITKFFNKSKCSNTYEAIDIKFKENVFVRELYVEGLLNRSEDSIEIVSSQENNSIKTEYLNNFEEEARFLQQLNVKNIISVTDMFRANNTSYYVFKHIDGELLSEQIKRRNKVLNDIVVKTYLMDILKSLSTFHQHGFWHLDITPSNIMIDNDGHAILFNFGHYKLIKDKNSTNVKSDYDPEELQNQDVNNIGPWTDFYILGSTLYNVITGKLPPLPSENNESTKKIYHFPTSISKKMQRLILWMMTPNIFRRPQDIGEITDFLVGMQESSKEQSKKNDDVDNTILQIEKSKSTNSKSNIINDYESDDDENEDDDGGLSNTTIKSMQIFIFIAIVAVIGFLAYKYIFADDSKESERNSISIKKDSGEDISELVDSLRTSADIFTEEEKKEEEKKEEIKPDTTNKPNPIQEPAEEAQSQSETQDDKEDKNQPKETVPSPQQSSENSSTTESPVQSNQNASQTLSNQSGSASHAQQTTQTHTKIIVGSFENPDNANNRLEEVKNSGYNATIIQEGNLYKVIVQSSSTEEAQKALEQLKQKYNDAWIPK